MRLTQILAALVLCVPIIGNQACSDTTIFSSRYTDFQRDCATPAWVEAQRSDWENDHPDERYPYPDPEVLACKPIGNWRVLIYWSAIGEHVLVMPLSRQEPEANDLIGSRLGNGKKHPPLEWRVVNGEPFAVIFREQEYRENPEWSIDSTGTPQFVVTQERLVIRGLGKHTGLDGRLLANTPDANLKARAMADTFWHRQRKAP